MGKLKAFFTTLMVLVAAGTAFAQSEVTGVITDANTGEPVPFAFVRVQGTMNGTTSDVDGVYSIKVSSDDAVLTFSSVGYLSQDQQVAGRKTINVALKLDATALDDAVVVAYGTVKREAVTGSVSTVKGDGLADVPVTSVDKMLSGKLAGVTISTTSGQPGAVSAIRVRGTGSINASNAPLWVIDGIPVITGDIGASTNQSNAMASLNPNDIENITILKDAAAAAAYGSRAANGVVLVTTKRGKEGDSSFTARAKYGINWLQSDSGFRMMNAKELLDYQRASILNAGMNPDDSESAYYRPYSLIRNQKTFDQIKELTRMGTFQEYEISARGGNSKATYYSTLSYQKSDGVFYGVDFSKLQGRLNVSYKLLKNLETGVNINLSYTEQNDVPMQDLYYHNPLLEAKMLLPWDNLRNEDGSWNLDLPILSNHNARAFAEYGERWDHTYHLNVTEYITWTPVKNLDLSTKNSFEGFFQRSRQYTDNKSIGGDNPNWLRHINQQIIQITTSNTATYHNSFLNSHNLRVVLGQEAMKSISENDVMGAESVNPNLPWPQTGPQTRSTVSYGVSRETMLSFFGIADYNYDNRYFAQANVRTDGSSLFGANNKWGVFWAVSGSWNISNEKFFSNVRPVSLLKLRLSYGVNGNNAISPYRSYPLYANITYNGASGYLPAQIENKNLSWEKNKTWNVGVDASFLRNRISFNVDVYNRKTVDMLLSKRIPSETGFGSVFSNIGSMRNRGVELQLSGDIISNNDMLWTVGANIAFNRTKVLDLGDDEEMGTSLKTVVGKSMYNYYLYDYYGVDPSNGEMLWVAESGKLTNNASDARKRYCGSPEPKAVGGFNTSFAWKGLSLGVFFEFKTGQKAYLIDELYMFCADGNQMNMNQIASASKYWKKPGDVGVNPKPYVGNNSQEAASNSTRWLYDASYLRLKDVTLSYTLPRKWTSKIYMKGVRVYVSGLNLYCFNDVEYFDPEFGVQGYTAGQYPLTKSVIGGLEITF